jgi:hypothetical protein
MKVAGVNADRLPISGHGRLVLAPASLSLLARVAGQFEQQCGQCLPRLGRQALDPLRGGKSQEGIFHL